MIPRMREALIVGIYTLVFFGALPFALWSGGGALDSIVHAGQLTGRAWPAAGTALSVAGSGLMLWCMWLLRVEGKGWPISHLPPERLVQRGPYRWLRHPIYIGYTLAFSGAGILSGSMGRAVGATILLTFGWMLYARYFEEPRLQRRLGAPMLDCRGRRGGPSELWRLRRGVQS